MSKKRKRLDDLFTNPPPKDFTWLNFLAVMKSADFKATCTGGSHYMFEHSTRIKLRISKTHPSGILKNNQIMDAREVVVKVGSYKKENTNG